MNFLDHWLLTILLLLPAAGGVVVLFLRSPIAVRRTTLGLALFTLGVALLVLILFHRQPGKYDYAPAGTVQMVCEAPIVPSLHLTYRVAVDGLSLPFVLLTALAGVLACGMSWKERDRPAAYFAMILWLVSATLGVFLSFDLLLLWLFLAASLVPCCGLILLAAGSHRGRAVIVFLAPMLIGAACLFVAALGERLISTRCFVGGTLDIVRLGSAPCGERTLFLLVLIGFVVRIPLFPFHSWLVAISENVPPAAMTLLIGLVPLTGGYGLLRVAMPLFPAVAAGWWWILAGLGIVTILYSAMNAIGETNLRRAMAHVTVSMTGFACLGIALPTAVGANGAAMILLSQALIGPCMLSLLGDCVRRNGLWTAGLVVGWLAELSIPGLLGQMMVLLGAIQAHSLSPVAIDLLIVGLCFGMVLIGTAAVICMRRSAALAAPTSPASPATVGPVAIAAINAFRS